MKKIILASAAVALVSAAHADTFKGFYTGASIGAAMNKASASKTSKQVGQTSATPSVAVTYSPADVFKDGKKTGFAYSLFTGFGHTFNSAFYVGGELALKGDTSESKMVGTNSTTAVTTPATAALTVPNTDSYSVKNSFGVNIGPRFGYVHNNMMFAIKFGLDYKRYSYTVTNGAASVLNADAVSGGTNVTTASTNMTKGTGVFGVSVSPMFEYKFSNNVITRIAYEFSSSAFKAKDFAGKKVSFGHMNSNCITVGAALQF